MNSRHICSSLRRATVKSTKGCMVRDTDTSMGAREEEMALKIGKNSSERLHMSHLSIKTIPTCQSIPLTQLNISAVLIRVVQKMSRLSQ